MFYIELNPFKHLTTEELSPTFNEILSCQITQYAELFLFLKNQYFMSAIPMII